jgi:ankyrin repeat protein
MHAHGPHQVAKYLLEHGAKVAVRDASGWTAHTVAMYRGHLQLADLLEAALRAQVRDVFPLFGSPLFYCVLMQVQCPHSPTRFAGGWHAAGLAHLFAAPVVGCHLLP